MRRAFSLVELLVVIAVIALLLAILAPSAMSIVEHTRRSACANNHHLLSLASASYSSDNLNFLPYVNSRALDAGGYFKGPGWLYDWSQTARNCTYKIEDLTRGVLWRYINSISVYRCPLEQPSYSGSNALTSYLMNRGFIFDDDLTNVHPWRTVDIVGFAGEDVIMYWEAATSDWNDGCSYPQQDLTRRHKEGATVSCVGGHAVYITHRQYEMELTRKPGRLWCNPLRADGVFD